jgi:perosamine synthetase
MTLVRRLSSRASARLRRRVITGRMFRALLAPHVRLPGSATRRHTFWLFPVLTNNPDTVISALRAAGFDATRGATSIAVVAAPPTRSELHPQHAERMMDRLLFVPVYPETGPAALRRLAELVNRLCADTSSVPITHAVGPQRARRSA